jgi:hypothetical protein
VANFKIGNEILVQIYSTNLKRIVFELLRHKSDLRVISDKPEGENLLVPVRVTPISDQVLAKPGLNIHQLECAL